MLDFGILGMNARNLHYIKKFNAKKAIRLADNKYKTKRFLSQRDIPVPKTYSLIRNRNELYGFDFSRLPTSEFIIKPNKGSRGRGIHRVKLIDQPSSESNGTHLNLFQKFFWRQSDFHHQRYQIGGNEIDDTTFRRYLVDILDGKNSLTTSGDKVLIEELLVPGSGFEQYCTHGLADIRVIVFNLIPVAAMLRIPTAKSDGTANLARGAVGLGIEVGTGKISSIYEGNKVYKDSFPEPYKEFAHQHIPYRDDILLYSSRVQYFANLGFLALDWVITDDGPKLLEINARAGLKFQNASLLPLKDRLKKIGDVKVNTPEKGVEIAQTLFSLHKAPVVTLSRVVYLSQHGRFSIGAKEQAVTSDVIIEVNLDKKNNYLPSHLYKQIEKGEGLSKLIFTDQKIKLKNLKRKEDKKMSKNKVMLGREAVADYYVKPINKIFTSLNFIKPKHITKSEIDDLHILDQKLDKIGKILNTSRILKPTNYLDQLDNFITWNGRYNPRFKYRRPSESKLSDLKDELLYLKDSYFDAGKLQSDFAQLFAHKIDELLDKAVFVQAYRRQDFDAIRAANFALFGEMNQEYLELSASKVGAHKKSDISLLGKKLTQLEIREMILTYLKEHNLDGVRVKFEGRMNSRIVVSKGKYVTIKVALGAGFREKSLLATLAHEVDVHIKRYIAGKKTGWNLLRSGTAKYMADEEGLAIHHSFEELPDEYEKRGMYYKYYLLNLVDTQTFSGLADHVRQLDRHRSLAGSFKTALRLKKGIQKTGIVQHGAGYWKDKIYLDGYTRVSKWIEEGGDIEELMIGKIKIADLPYIR